MAATGFFYKKWTDGGAPSLTPTAGSLIAVLDWVLDIGTATYWEKVYSGTNKAVYRSKTGIRPYLRVDDTYGEGALLRMYETMSDVDTGTNPVPNGVNQVVANMRIPKCDAGENNSHAYHAVGDSEFFALAINGDESYSFDGNNAVFFRPMYFGEIASFLAVDNYPCILGATSEATNDADYNDVLTDLWGTYGGKDSFRTGGDNGAYTDPNTAELYWMRTPDGVTVGSGGKPWALLSNTGLRLDVENPAMIQPFYIQCSNGINSGSASAFWSSGNGGAKVRGRLPYLYEGTFIPSSTYGGPAPEDTITIGSEEYIVLPCFGSVNSLGWSSTRTGLMRISDNEPDR